MSMTIGTNMASLVAQRSLEQSGRDMGVAMERLATGSRINSASDDAAGLALASRMAGQISGLNAASKNITDGIALTDAIEGSLEEVGDILQRMRGLAVQAASDTTSGSDRTLLNNEMTALNNELTALSSRTQFAGQNIIDGSYSGKLIQVGDTANETISITQSSVASDKIGAFTLNSATLAVGKHTTSHALAMSDGAGTDDNRPSGNFTITGNGHTTGAIGDASTDTAKAVAAEVNALTGKTGVLASAITKARVEFTTATQGFTLNSVAFAFAGNAGDDAVVAAINEKTAQTGIVATANADGARMYTLTDVTGADILIEETADEDVKVRTINLAGTASGEQTIKDSGTEFGVVAGHLTLTSDKEFTTTETGVGYFDTGTGQASFLSTAALDTQANANTAISTIDGAINRVASMRADLGSVANRLEHALDSTVMLRDSTENARSKIVDTDYSAESANLAKNQVLQQVGTAMLAQANAAPQLVLQLIQ